MRIFASRILMLFNVFVASMQLLTVFLTHVSPSDYPWMALVGLSFPLWLLLNLLCVFLWILLNWKKVWLACIPFFFSFSAIWDFCPVNTPETVSEEGLKVMTYNTAFYNGGASDKSGNYPICEYIEHSDVDIICLQESKEMSGIKRYGFDQKMKKRGYKTRRIGAASREYLRVYSKHPILSVYRIPYRGRINGSIAVEVLYEGDTVLVVNNHFESYALTESDKEVYHELLKAEEREKVEVKSKRILQKMHRACRQRGTQVDAVCEYVKGRGLKAVIVCGDFNEPPVSYSSQRFSSFLQSAYAQSGVGIGATYRKPGFTFRIDHIFISDYWESTTTYVDRSATWSDHFPLVTHLKKR